MTSFCRDRGQRPADTVRKNTSSIHVFGGATTHATCKGVGQIPRYIEDVTSPRDLVRGRHAAFTLPSTSATLTRCACFIAPGDVQELTPMVLKQSPPLAGSVLAFTTASTYNTDVRLRLAVWREHLQPHSQLPTSSCYGAEWQ